MYEEKDPKKLENLLKDYGDSGLRKIVRQTQRLSALNRILVPCLPENLRTHCQVGQISPTEWTILVDGAAWLTHLRYFKAQLLQSLKKQPQCSYLQDIHFRILPARFMEAEVIKPHRIPSLSAANKELLQDIASTVDNPLLKQALINLTK